ncbi:ion transporter [Leuconostoc litchii]|uniref:Ion transporter n=1 Tax=Leuconostoc litchii TaxID=1981069 RepID=A0A6P2CP44_9LACO|nr:potassium channel family protein [Leuconostoc litchii]TYC46751.1 ion transporter [Leuconostoc litchii]GMA70633.1 ion transporter [Leuconostoc litchii]
MKKIYYPVVLILSITSITLALLDISNVININLYPYNYMDKLILLFFWIDYLSRLYISKDKKNFFKHNIFDLLAIIPFDSIFYLFRVLKVLRVIKLLRLIRIIGFTAKIQKNIKRFFNTNGFMYLIITAVVLILVGAEMYSVAENVSYMNSLWWAIATTTTVGYGDISPHTEIGRFIAVVLMILGIGLIGSVTSTVTAFFVDEKSEKENDLLKTELQDIKQELKEITKELSKRK